VFETPIGYKYIADRMLKPRYCWGEESGELVMVPIFQSDALLSALRTEAVAKSGMDLSDLYDRQSRTNFTSAYDRIDLPLASMDVRSRLLEQLQNQP